MNMDIYESISKRVEAFLFQREPSTGIKYGVAERSINFFRLLYLAVQKSQTDDLQSKAHALTYITALAAVPILALSFSIAKGFGMAMALQQFITQRMTGVQPEVLDRIFQYVQNTNVKTLGTLGLLILLYSVVKTLGRMEMAFNDIWKVSQQRSFFRKFSDYLSIIILCPFLVLAATGVTASFRSNTMVDTIMGLQYMGTLIRFLLPLGSYIVLWVAFTAIYIFLPNTRVRITHALAGGIIAGTMWNLVQMIYITFQVGVSKYNAIYGTFASLPLFLIWLYLSWVILLFGAEIAWVMKGSKTAFTLKDAQHYHPTILEHVAAKILMVLGDRFEHGQSPPGTEELARELRVEASLVNALIQRLVKNNIVVELAGEPPTYQPARSLAHITLEQVAEACSSQETYDTFMHSAGLKPDRVDELLREARDLWAARLSQTTVEHLVSAKDKA